MVSAAWTPYEDISLFLRGFVFSPLALVFQTAELIALTTNFNYQAQKPLVCPRRLINGTFMVSVGALRRLKCLRNQEHMHDEAKANCTICVLNHAKSSVWERKGRARAWTM